MSATTTIEAIVPAAPVTLAVDVPDLAEQVPELQSALESNSFTQQRSETVTWQVFPKPPSFGCKNEQREYEKGRLALAFRILARMGMNEGTAGHITLRDPSKPDHFWVNPLGRPFSLMRRSDLILVNPDGVVVAGGANRLLNRAAYNIHHAIHTARPDVNCAVHSHSLYGRTFSTLGKDVDMLTQDACVFYNDVALYDSFNGVVLGKEEGEHIAKALGRKKAAILQNHGLLTVSETVDAAIFWFTSLDSCCHTQLLAEAAGAPIKVDEEEAAFTYQSAGSPAIGWFQAQPLFEIEELESKGSYLL
jgi:ribulose-5-phosphate 4-epimerase/fuculose-1-phosphate aldolase